MGLSTGCERLDELLGGGVPDRRSLLVSGPPGTGKTTLGMQFLQAGLDDGEDCLFVSTEQTIDELADTFEPYPFDLEAEGLTVITVHCEPGDTMERDDDLVVRTLEGGDRAVTEWFDLPFTRENVVHYLSEYGPRDRILLDSLSGLRPIAADEISFWRSTYDLIRLFSDTFDATSLLTAEDRNTGDSVASELLRYATHGVVELSWDERANQRHRFLRVEKLRGRDHDTRRHKLVFGESGVTVQPTQRTPPSALLAHDHLSTGVDALDDLLGGGLVRGGFTLLSHDGTTGYYTINTRMLASALDAGMAVAVALPAAVSLSQLDRYWTDADWTVADLLDDDRLFVLELVESNGCDHRNVLSYDDEQRDWDRLMELSYERSGDRPLFALVDTEPLLERVSRERVRAVRYRAAARYTEEDDVVVYTINPAVQDTALVEFLVDTSNQTIRIERGDDGIEWLTLRKSPTGSPGTSKVVAYDETPPYVDLV
ncbi:RAD55 family ATPase [Halosimplex halobium]|uniref:RAD55 family ATPase n=1 Tax=Halosimplex halobium TaxID=3396618 RepID=UPI003F556ED3